MEASMFQEEGRTGVEKEGEKKLKKKKKNSCRKDGLDLAGMHHPSFPGPSEAATAQETRLLGPKVTFIFSPSLIFTPTNRSVSVLPLTSPSGIPSVKHA